MQSAVYCMNQGVQGKFIATPTSHARVWLCMYTNTPKYILYRLMQLTAVPSNTIQFTTSTFQAVLITDGSASYAVFIYDCGGMEWGGATIGWARTGTAYADHPLSGSSSASIGCKYSTISSAIIFRLETNCKCVLFTETLFCVCDRPQCIVS